MIFGVIKNGKFIFIKYIGEIIILFFDEFFEFVILIINMMYVCFNLDMKYYIGCINVGIFIFMWVLGKVLGMFVLELVMDELSYVLELDFIEFWFCNYVDVDFGIGYWWFSKFFKECY